MINKIYSAVEPGKLLHMVITDVLDSKYDGRLDIISGENFLQCSVLGMGEGKTFVPHRHIKKHRSYTDQIAQESWVVLRGKVECTFYDLDDGVLCKMILNQFDASFTLEGGHNYLILEDGTRVLEYKTGPYEGQEFDKTFINEQ